MGANTSKKKGSGRAPNPNPPPPPLLSHPLPSLSLYRLGGGERSRMDEQGLAGFGGGRMALQGHGGRDAMLLLQQQQQLEEAEEARRQMFGGMAFPGVLGYGQQSGDGEEAGGLGDSDAGGSEPEPAPSRSRGGSGSKRSRAAEVHNLSEKRRRSRINEKMKALQSLIPNSNKTDKASMLDEAIDYLKQLQLQVQMLSMRNGVYLNPPYISGALEAAQASQMFAALGGGNITASSSGAVLLPVNQSSGSQYQAFDPLHPPSQSQPASVILPNVPDRTIPESPFHLESSQSHLRSFKMPESSEMMLRGELMAKHQLTSAQERVNLLGNDVNAIRQESSIINTDRVDGCSRSKEGSHDMVPKNTGHA